MDPISEIENAQSFGGRATTKALTEAKTTPVILVCIYNKNSTLITHDLLYTVFSAYGKILKILIFEKVKVWKAFIEFSSVDEAVEAKTMLNDFQIFSDGTRINVYFSNLDSVKFQNNNSGGIDYTQTGTPNLSDFKGEFPLPVPEPTGNIQPDMTPTYQNQFINENNTFDQFAERSTSTNSQSQPNSVKWSTHETEEQDDRFSGQHYDPMRDREVPRYDQGPIQENEEHEEGHFIHEFLNNAFPTSWNNQELGIPKRKTQALQLNSPAFNDPAQPTHPIRQQHPMQNPPNSTPYWSQGAPNSGLNPPHNLQNNAPIDTNAPPGLLNFYPGQNKIPMQESRPMPGDRMIRMTGSLTNIPLRQNLQGPSTLSRHATVTDLPNTSPMNASPMNLGFLPRPSTMTELPKTSGLLKPNLPYHGSVTNLPNVSNLGGFMGGMSQGRGQGMNQNMNQQMHQGPPQLTKPMLNSRIGSTPELPLMSEISKFKLDSMSSQSIRDLIERDILLRLMMNQIQSNDNDLLQQNLNVINDLNDIKKFSPALSGLGNTDLNDLAQMNKGTLDHIYRELSSLLGKSVETNKECAVLYVKGLEHKDIKVRMLYNIFSNFGNIKKIIFIRRQAAALIEYETVEYAAKAKEDLSNIVFMGKPLRIYYSFHPIINLKNKKNGKDASEEIFIGTPKTFRFGKAKPISMNSPSATLHISNLTKEVCNEEVMRNFFAPYGRIEAIQIKCMENNRNMCLIRMASMEESLNAMAFLHDIDLGGRPIQISFTKSKI